MREERDLAGLTELVDGLRRDRRRGPYAGRREYVHTAWAVHGMAGHLLEAGQAAEVAPQLRKAVDRITAALTHLDDSSGMAGDALRALTPLYGKALAEAPPKNPAPLANWIAKTTFDGPGWPDISLADFHTALGEAGIARLAALVEERAATSEATERFGLGFHVQDLREQLASLSGDTDAYIAVVARSLTTPGQYGKIVQALCQADRTAEALDWARRGIEACTGSPYLPPLRDQLVALLIADGRRDEALAVRQDAFTRTPVHTAFLPLSATAVRLDSPEAVTWALGHLRERLAADPANAALVRELIACLSEVGDSDAAWQVATAHLPQLSTYTLQELIEERRTTHPADVIAPYRRLIDLYLAEGGNKYRYQYAVRHLKALRTVHRELGTEPEFTGYLASLRAEHKRKTGFIARLDKAGPY
ncbi:hypothetical protein OG585_37780 [Streptomyces sp. NBC_01340]|uniref:DUF6880 family protein n=1 Tax=unclassified Streptomyces TaxID=2593676 RepID=UPI00225607C3|nr:MULTISPECIES: DUF6880 family protein [unclassified Streptomyces]MCX4458275.1 hypothetical protein [Streptomyces sp. NBC_01719]MCX4497632.1 hypothetical protein [Streptomyces sp. NBC_01728]WSI42458.1 hypothetical protein OG585_37780 [Streptomyces sp. NBC_01340]